MSKRMTETGKWADRWFRSLTPELKCLWLYLCDNCDQAGVIEPDYDLIEFVIGRKIDWRVVPQSFRGKIIELSEHRWWLPKFIKFQNGKLAADCRPHQHVVSLLEKHNLMARYHELEESGYKSLEECQTLLGLTETRTAADRPPQGQPEAIPARIVTGRQRTSESFPAFWEAYPKCERKTDKKKCLKHWEANNLDSLWGDISKGLEVWKKSESWSKDNGQFIPMPYVWLNNRRWEGAEDIAAPVSPAQAADKKRIEEGHAKFNRELVIRDCVEAMWRQRDNQAEFSATLRVLNDKFPRRDYGLNKDGKSVIEEAIEIYEFRKKRNHEDSAQAEGWAKQ